jgi:O-acetyl-ADP-ribose deacetylase
MSAPRITAVRADITTLRVDVVVNAANRAMRGGGGVDGAIHAAGGRAVLDACVERFPNGLATGDAGWTPAGDLPARWVVHTVGPNYNAGETDRRLLQSCYRRALELADELHARSIAFPLISAGVYGWPRRDAIAIAVETIASAQTSVEDVQLVAFDQTAFEAIDAELARATPLRILQGVRALHQRGYHGARILPGMSPSGMYWRVSVTASDRLDHADAHTDVRDRDLSIDYTTGAGAQFAGAQVTVTTSADLVADVMLSVLPPMSTDRRDPGYVRWYEGLMQLVEPDGALPIAYADYFDDAEGWEIGWGSGVRYPPPPPSAWRP